MVITITTPVLLIGLGVAYLAVNSVVTGIGNLIKGEKKSEEKDK